RASILQQVQHPLRTGQPERQPQLLMAAIHQVDGGRQRIQFLVHRAASVTRCPHGSFSAPEEPQKEIRMNTDKDTSAEQGVRDWWRTSIIEMSPGVIRYRGYPIEQLIGRVSLPHMIWLMTRGELPSDRQAFLLDAALMAAVDHGPQAPSIAIARM